MLFDCRIRNAMVIVPKPSTRGYLDRGLLKRGGIVIGLAEFLGAVVIIHMTTQSKEDIVT